MRKLLALLLILPVMAWGQQQVVNIGNGVGTGTGDPAWLAFTKLNTNEGQLYGMFGTGTSLQTTGKVSQSDLFGIIGTVQPAHGGLGATSLTGVLFGNGASAATVATSAQILTALASANSVAGNTVIGPTAGGSITSGGGNTVVGQAVASTTLTTGTSNILIGVDSTTDTYAAATAKELNINNVIRGSMLAHSSGALSSCGSSPTLKTGSTELAGTITTGSGATACTLAFNTATGTPPTCLVTARSGTPPVYSTTDNGSTAGILLTTAAASAVYDYWCPLH